MKGALITLLIGISLTWHCECNRKGTRPNEQGQFARLRSSPPLRVTAVLSDPYVMKKITPADKDSGELEGFCIDMMNLISHRLGFNYTVELVEHNKYGSFDSKTGQWNGMIGKLVNREADAAIGDLTKTRKRAQVVDFTDAWRTLGVGVLFTKPVAEGVSLFHFLSAFDWLVWLTIAICYLLMGVIIFALAKISGQSVTQNGHRVTLWKCLMFRQIPFRGISQMIAVGAWFLFALFVVCTYIANVVRIMNVQPKDAPTIHDLVQNKRVKFGCVRGGSTCHFLRNTFDPMVKSMHQRIEAEPDIGYPISNEIGIENVRAYQGQYAHLMESPSIEYYVDRNCDLMQVGGILNKMGYAIGLIKGSPYLDLFNEAILEMEESGQLLELTVKWFKQERGGGQCSPHDPEASKYVTLIGFDYMGGIFILLLIGVVLAFIVAIVEKIVTRKQHKKYAPQAKEELSTLQERA